MIQKREESRVFCATGKNGGVKPDCSPEGSVDKSWEKAGERETSRWDEESLQKKSPIKDSGNVKSVHIANSGVVRDAMKGLGVNLDDAVNLAGGAIRGSHISVDAFYDDIEVETVFPINPDDESEGYIASSVTIIRDEDTGEPSIHYGSMFPMKEIRIGDDGRVYPTGDIKPDKLTQSQRSRISSILLERFVESVSVAENKGFSFAEMLAVGDAKDGSDRGYRLWPQFGFDGNVPAEKLKLIPDEVVLKSAGISIPPEGAVRAPRATIVKGLRGRVKGLTIQQLISSTEGKRWWDENGGTVDLRLDLRDKASPGYQRFLEKKAQVERLKKRNETRSLADIYYEIVYERAFCPNGEGGGVSNECSSEGGGGTATAAPPSETIRSGSSVPITSGKQWKRADDIVYYSGKDIPTKVLKEAESVSIVHGRLLNTALKDIGVTLDQAAQICAATTPGSVVMVMHGTLSESQAYFDNPDGPEETSAAVTFFSKVDIDGNDSAVAIGTTIERDKDGKIVLSYGMLDVTDKAKEASPVAIARAMYRGVAESITAAESAGVKEVSMFAAGGVGDTDRFKGYRIWPRLGFDGVIPRKSITPTWSLTTGFFNSYGSSIPNRILSPRAIAEKKKGLLTIQALYETKEGQEWWEENGGPMVMTMQVGDKTEPGWQRFLAMRDKATRRSLSNDEFFDWLDFEWRHIVEQRGFCPNGEGGGVTNTCSSQEKMGPDKDSGGGSSKSSKKSNSDSTEQLAWKPGDGHPDAFDAVRQSPPMTRGPDGKMTSSEYSREDREITSFAGKEFASVEAVSRHLLKATAETRGRVINTRAKGGLSGDEMEYMVSSLTQQVRSAQSRGHSPLFYSADELKAQTDHYTQIHPVLKGGMTASGLCIGVIGSDGSCNETDSITPEGEFLFRAIQALTSPQANPDINMQRADQAITHFLTEPDPNFSGLDHAPYFMDMTHQGFVKLQKIIDKIGLTKTAEIFNGPPMKRSDIEKFFQKLGISGVAGTKQYAAEEVVPMFSVFGPKVGTFFSNNNGNLEPLTADVWFTRTWTRLSGELLKETSPDTAKKHARELLKPSLRRHLNDQDLGTTPVEELISGLEHMQKTGEIPAVVEAWATARFKRYGKEGFAKRTEKKFGKQYTTVGDLSRSVLDNLPGAVGDPQGTVQRSNMIKVMREVSKRTGIPVAHCQDLLWQDEQDIWAAAGARTFTEVGEVSLYSTGIQKMVTDPSKRKPLPERKAPKKKAAVASRSSDHDLADEGVIGVGDLEQLTFADDIQDVDPEVFAEAFIKMFGGEATAEKRNFAALDFGVAAATAFVGRVAESLGVRAFCPTGDGGGVDNSCSADDSSGSPQLHAASERLTPRDIEKMISGDSKASRSVEDSMKLLKSKKRFELVGSLTKSMPTDSVDAGDFSSKTVASAAPKGKRVSDSLSREIEDAVEGIYGDLIRTANEQKFPRSLAIKDATLKTACFVSQMAAGVKEYPDILDSPVHVMRGTDIFDRMIDEGLGVAEAVGASQHAAAMYSGADDIIIVNADAGIGYINSVIAAAASEKNEDTGEWESVSGGIPFYSTSQLGHSLAHEHAHMLHYRAVRTELGLPHGKKLEKDEMLSLSSSLRDKCASLMSHLRDSPEVGEKLKGLSGYAMSNPLETVAEYYTALALGIAKRDSDIDEVMVILGFPKDKLPAGKKGKKQ